MTSLLAELRRRYSIQGCDLVQKTSRVSSRVGNLAGTESVRGYRVCEFTMAGKPMRMMAHRIVWMLHNRKTLPESAVIDHIDGNKSNNEPSNLRRVGLAQNAQNRRAASSNAKSELLGVCWVDACRLWRASLRVRSKLHHLGYHRDVVAAVNAYWANKKTLDLSMTRSWEKVRREQVALARKLYPYNGGLDGKQTASKTLPIVSERLLAKLRIKNKQRLEKAKQAKSLLKVLRLRVRLYKGILIWRSSPKEALLGRAVGRTHVKRCTIDITVAGKRKSFDLHTVAWMLIHDTTIPSGYCVQCSDRSNFTSGTLGLVRRYKKRKT